MFNYKKISFVAALLFATVSLNANAGLFDFIPGVGASKEDISSYQESIFRYVKQDDAFHMYNISKFTYVNRDEINYTDGKDGHMVVGSLQASFEGVKGYIVLVAPFRVDLERKAIYRTSFPRYDFLSEHEYSDKFDETVNRFTQEIVEELTLQKEIFVAAK